MQAVRWRFSTNNLKAWQEESGNHTLTKWADAIKQLHPLQQSKFLSYLFITDALLLFHLARHSGSLRKGMELAWKKIGKKNVHTVWKMYLLHSFIDEIWDSNVIQRWVFHRMRQQRLSSSHSLLGTLQGHSHCIITLWTLTYFLMTMAWVICVHHTPDTSIPAGIWKKLNTRACSILTSLIQFSFNNNNKSLLI